MTVSVAPSIEVKRIQRQRTKGWRMPEGAIYVGRGSRWGNKYRVGQNTMYGQSVMVGRQMAVRLFRNYASSLAAAKPDWLEPLRGHDLVCWCPLDQPCHADVLLEMAA